MVSMTDRRLKLTGRIRGLTPPLAITPKELTCVCDIDVACC